jgi:hypothetical protein
MTAAVFAIGQLQGNYKYDVMARPAGRKMPGCTVSYRAVQLRADSALKHRTRAVAPVGLRADRRCRRAGHPHRLRRIERGCQKIATINGEIDSGKAWSSHRQQFREGAPCSTCSTANRSVCLAAQVTNAIAMQAAEYRVLQKLGGLDLSAAAALPPEGPRPNRVKRTVVAVLKMVREGNLRTTPLRR